MTAPLSPARYVDADPPSGAPTTATRGAEQGIFEAWLGSTDDGAIAIDAAGRVLLHNASASRVTGLAPSSAITRPWREVLRLDPPIADAIWSVRVSGTAAHLAAEILCAQGNLRTAEVSASPWREAQGGVGVLVVIRDLAILCRQRTAPGGRHGYGSLVGAHPSMLALFDLIEAVAASDATVLIEGESGTGKELVAQLLHARSRRAERPFIAVNCAALPVEAVDAEIFGRVRSATAGASAAVIGRFELAHTGTLFLEEVGALPLAAQAKLIRFFQTGEIDRTGDASPRHADVRVVAASTVPLEGAVREGRFREDLHYRLKVIRMNIPPLRERAADIPELADHFLARHGPAGAVLSAATIASLRAYRWPGNVRELQHAIRHAVAELPAEGSGMVGPELLPPEVRAPADAPAAAMPPSPIEDRRSLLLRALSAHGGNRTAAARSLGIGRATFYRWWRDAGLGPDATPPRASGWQEAS